MDDPINDLDDTLGDAAGLDDDEVVPSDDTGKDPDDENEEGTEEEI